MMNLGNMIIPFLTFGGPVAAILFFALKGKTFADSEHRAGIALFSLALFASLIGIFQFTSPVKMEFLLPLATDSSGYFEPSLQLHWLRYTWIFLSAAVLTGMAIFDGSSSFGGSRGVLRFLFLSGSLLFLSLAYLSENFLLSLMFIEITIFLLHSFSVEMGGPEGELERVSYFKRNSFIVLGLIAILAVTAANEFTTSSVVLLGVVLYVMAMMLSKHNFSDWRYVPLAIIQAGTLFFLLSRVMREDMSNELWLPLTILFAVATAIFSGLSFLASSTLSASFWMVFAVIGYLFFFRFSSVKPNELIWSGSEAAGLLCAYGMTVLFRFGQESDQAWKKVLLFLFALFLLSSITGVLPLAGLAFPHGDNHEPVVKSVTMGLLTFLLALVTAKSLVMSFRQGKPSGTNGPFLLSMMPALVATCVVLAALVRALESFAQSAFPQVMVDLFADLPTMIRGSALLAGMLTGGLLGSNMRLLNWSAQREKKMEDLFPRIDPVVIRWNQAVAEAPERGLAWLGERAEKYQARGATALQNVDRLVFAEKFPGGLLAYGAGLSRAMRFLHSGNMRFYFFFGTLATILAAALFLLGGK